MANIKDNLGQSDNAFQGSSSEIRDVEDATYVPYGTAQMFLMNGRSILLLPSKGEDGKLSFVVINADTHHNDLKSFKREGNKEFIVKAKNEEKGLLIQPGQDDVCVTMPDKTLQDIYAHHDIKQIGEIPLDPSANEIADIDEYYAAKLDRGEWAYGSLEKDKQIVCKIGIATELVIQLEPDGRTTVSELQILPGYNRRVLISKSVLNEEEPLSFGQAGHGNTISVNDPTTSRRAGTLLRVGNVVFIESTNKNGITALVEADKPMPAGISPDFQEKVKDFGLTKREISLLHLLRAYHNGSFAYAIEGFPYVLTEEEYDLVINGKITQEDIAKAFSVGKDRFDSVNLQRKVAALANIPTKYSRAIFRILVDRQNGDRSPATAEEVRKLLEQYPNPLALKYSKIFLQRLEGKTGVQRKELEEGMDWLIATIFADEERNLSLARYIESALWKVNPVDGIPMFTPLENNE